MNKHTKGPWQTRDTNVLIRDADNNDVCIVLGRDITVEGTAGQVYASDIRAHDARANAKLIAAAPELLRELQAAIFYIETYGGDVTANFAAGGNLEVVKRIINKAKGGV